ncbi:MAG: hypothetical protein RLZZ385_2502 [Pseudomonadota bacterium]|jgi:hypothetical protein
MNLQRYVIPCIAVLLPATTLAAEPYEPPRTEYGRPDLQGYWTNASLTNLQRFGRYDGLVIPHDQIEAVTAANAQVVRAETDDGLVPGELLDGSDLAQGRGYNAFWVDPGTSYGLVKGEYRSSWIIDPPSGRIPFSEEGNRLRREHRAQFGSDDGPEGRSLGERCIIGFGSTGGPPMNNVLYNNLYQIVQTNDYVVILVEMVHDARIIPIGSKGAPHRPAEHQPWLGDSIGWWEGDTLVVETVNLHWQQAPFNSAPLSAQGRIIEKFTRYSDEQILYEFEVEDPVYYTASWKGEMSLNHSDEMLYEYACHEGNYGLIGILAGARRQELDGAGESP